MASNIQCPNPACETTLVVTDEIVGRRLRCSLCGFKLIISETENGFLATARADSKESTLEPPAARPARLGRYEIREKLGSGAFGSVYRAYDTIHSREVALKIPRDELRETPTAIERFFREARAVSLLNHPNIIPAHDFGIEGGLRYFASAYVEGKTLARAIAGRGLGHRLAARVAWEMADALQHAHDLGIVHRDVKPSNVIINRDGRAYLMDFGLARLAESEGQLTQDGFILGTPSYLPHEQALGKSAEADAASDQYSLGATLYEMLAGHPPFAGPLDIVLFATIHQPPPSLRSQDRSIPPDLESVCLKALAKRPAERYANCQELAEDLDRWLTGVPTLAGRLIEPPAPPAPLVEPEPSLSIEVLDESLVAIARPSVGGNRVGKRLLLTTFGIIVAVTLGLWKHWSQKSSAPLPIVESGRALAPPRLPRLSEAPDKSHLAGSVADSDLVRPRSDSAPGLLPRNSLALNKIGMAFVALPPGEFEMGAGWSDRSAFEAERPLHRVKISRGFYMGVMEVTQDQYFAITKEKPSPVKGERLPVVGVGWNEAVEFCRRLSELEDLIYRLPTEAEWEYACRAGNDATWSWGDDLKLGRDYAWFDDNSQKTLQPVGLKKPNAFGLYDMHGNAWEWCLDFGQESDGYAYQTGLQVDPINTVSGPNRLSRGGSFQHGLERARSGSRGCSYPPDTSFADFGFRVVCERPVAPASVKEAAPSPTIAPNPEPKTPILSAARSPKDDFTPLFNGRNFEGWIEPEDKSFFTIEDGEIVARSGATENPRNFYYLKNEKTYGDFLLKAKVKLVEGSAYLTFRSQPGPDGILIGPSFDVQEGFDSSLWNQDMSARLKVSLSDPSIKRQEWNDIEIRSQASLISVTLNGRAIVGFADDRLQSSGMIALKIPGQGLNDVRFKDILIKSLTPRQVAARTGAAKSKGRVQRTEPGVAPSFQVENGFVPLYVGGDPLKQGWEEVGSGKIEFEKGGILVTRGGEGFLAYSGQPFGDFILLADVQFSKESDNSGIFVRYNGVQPRFDPTNSCCEIDLRGDVETPGATGSIVFFNLDSNNSEKPIPQVPLGQWNRVGIKVLGRKLEVWVNDRLVRTHGLPDERRGFIGLQHWDAQSTVRFRNIRIKAD
jgi:formylglycine-generating enzyme required for sulfatase activity/predicted Ser/Thr protein kinase